MTTNIPHKFMISNLRIHYYTLFNLSIREYEKQDVKTL